MKKRYYLAYGSNLNTEQMQFRCPDATIAGTAVIPDYELLFKGSKTGSYLTIEKKKGAEVPIGIWEVSKEDEKRLDRYEGYPAFYYKKNIKIGIEDENGNVKTSDAFIYIMHEERELGVPSRMYIATCLQGYEDFGFDGDYIIKALERSRGGRNERE